MAWFKIEQNVGLERGLLTRENVLKQWDKNLEGRSGNLTLVCVELDTCLWFGRDSEPEKVKWNAPLIRDEARRLEIPTDKTGQGALVTAVMQSASIEALESQLKQWDKSSWAHQITSLGELEVFHLLSAIKEE